MTTSHAGARAFITDIDGLEPSPDEVAFLEELQPYGLILFARNVSEPNQVADLTERFREIVGRPHAPVLIDQEGGRVQRLRPPRWKAHPPARRIGDLHARDAEEGERAAWLHGASIGSELIALGIDVDCLPCLDVPVAGAHDVIGDRAFSTDLDTVIALGHAQIAGLKAAGVQAVIKHMPGHGRAGADTHYELPTVEADRASLEAQDYAAFRPFATAPYGMTAHVVHAAIDDERPATQSARVIEDVIRGTIGFRGLLMTDDLSMEALDGDHATRAARCIQAGCDVILHCNAPLVDRMAVGRTVPLLEGPALDRADAVPRLTDRIADPGAVWDELTDLLGWRAAA